MAHDRTLATLIGVFSRATLPDALPRALEHRPSVIRTMLDLLRACAPDLRTAPARPTRSVVYLVPSLDWGGAERLACTMHRLALAHGWNSRIDAPDIARVQNGIAAETGKGSQSGSTHAPTLRVWASAARARIGRERPDIVHAHLPFPDRFAAVALAARGRPLVATFHLLPLDGASWSPDELLPARSDRALAIVSHLRPRTHYVAVSTRDRERLSTLVPRAHITQIRNAPPFARAVLPDVPAIRWPDGAVRLLSVGRLHAQKGFDRMLDTLASAAVRELPWHWLIAGDGPERDALRARCALLDLDSRVEFAPSHPASLLYDSADIVLAPSRWEGMPLVPMEAVEAHRAVLVSDIAPHRELFAAIEDSLLPVDETRWPGVLASLIVDASQREALRTRQCSVLPSDPRGRMWEANESLYGKLLTAVRTP